MTGLKYEDHGEKVLNKLIPYLLKLDLGSEYKILNSDDTLNALDGGFVAAKLFGELGLLL